MKRRLAGIDIVSMKKISAALWTMYLFGPQKSANAILAAQTIFWAVKKGCETNSSFKFSACISDRNFSAELLTCSPSKVLCRCYHHWLKGAMFCPCSNFYSEKSLSTQWCFFFVLKQLVSTTEWNRENNRVNSLALTDLNASPSHFRHTHNLFILYICTDNNRSLCDYMCSTPAVLTNST